MRPFSGGGIVWWRRDRLQGERIPEVKALGSTPNHRKKTNLSGTEKKYLNTVLIYLDLWQLKRSRRP